MRGRVRSRLRQPVAVVFVLAVLVILGGLAAVTAADYRNAIRTAERVAQSTARLLEEHAKRSFDTADLALDSVVLAGRRSGLEVLSSREWHDVAARMRTRLPENGSIWVHGADGKAVLSSERHPAPPVDISDRPYFRAHAEGKEFVIGEVVRGRNSGEPLFTVSRRISDSAGRFLGVAVAPIRIGYFESFWSRLDLGANSMMALVRLDGGTVVTRQPGDRRGGERYGIEATPGETVRLRSLDGHDRIFASQPVRAYPVFASVGIAVDDALRPFHDRLRRNLALSAFALALAGLLGYRAAGLVRREEEARQDLQAALAQSQQAEVEALRAQAAAQAARRQAERADNAKSRFLAAASHDLRQPVQSLFLFAAVLGNQLAGHRAERTVKQLEVALGALRSLLDSLLDISRLEAGAVRPNLRPFPIGEVLEQMRVEYGLRAGEKGLRMRVVDCSATVLSDPALLGQMVRNLIENGLRYTERGGLLVGCRRRRDSVSIWVADSGCGIADENLEEIFEEFHQLGNPERDRAQGLGLGLSIVRRLSLLLNHPVAVASRPGHGSCFRVTVPLAAQDQAEASVADASA